MRARQVTKEDAMEFEVESRTYAHVLEHRRKCKKWAKEFCLDCFGGGLTQFTKDLEMEKSLSKTQANPEDLSANSQKNQSAMEIKVVPIKSPAERMRKAMLRAGINQEDFKAD